MRYLVPLILLVLILLLIGLLAWLGHRNMTAMKKSIEESMQILAKHYKVSARDAGTYDEIRIYGLMKFRIRQYDIETLGNLSVMTANMGFMQMASFVITPFEKNLPRLAMEHMYFPVRRKTYTEFYDLVPDTKDAAYQQVLEALQELRETASALADQPAGAAHWYDSLLTVQFYKSGTSGQDPAIHRLFCEAVRRYAEAAAALRCAKSAEKAAYTELQRQPDRKGRCLDRCIQKGARSGDHQGFLRPCLLRHAEHAAVNKNKPLRSELTGAAFPFKRTAPDTDEACCLYDKKLLNEIQHINMCRIINIEESFISFSFTRRPNFYSS